ncbi:cell differentiation, Rcd1-like protein [Actinidia rufa]|uniref:Cell differentiation, Rcd1-like protein n=1 Tax=Actinidia rufa TaxID=165716 RepID=A0A7J0G9C4_9ERIC|nr:cell differentiation, Rcd1-like protein [Actinidia rufa]
MVSLPQSLSMNSPFGGPGGSSAANAVGAPANKERKMQSAEQLVLDLSNPDLRENALLELSKIWGVCCAHGHSTVLPTECGDHLGLNSMTITVHCAELAEKSSTAFGHDESDKSEL